ncbi:MAG: hypothetical protein A2289_24210 [Deltaproteobacteria bacterium RIFOXYA12_FULL_58_15]|nr:MAG: hypothetical protein A2289_24210 [Deltaproteobacteria bacterium RIFOXYA12_FULL_58_15]OGR10131.1 MAG: hypothetical protein A2341_05980 [Deltaproteobacteria bacterium RIFOXYB12_FULL_58_9]
MAGQSQSFRITIASGAELIEKHGLDLKTGGMFIPSESPLPIGTEFPIEYCSPSGKTLFVVGAKVVYSRPATVPGDKTAGMGLELVNFDEKARQVIAKLDVPVDSRVSRSDSLAIDDLGSAPLGDGPIVGIDLGTTNSCVAVVRDGVPVVITTQQGYETVPSVIYLSEDHQIVVGHAALQKMVLEPQRCVYGSKRFIGRRFASKEVRTFGHFFHYDLAPAKSGLVAAKVGTALIPLELVAASILSYLKAAATHFLGTEVKRAVITVPAYFGELQRQAVREAGRAAKLEVAQIVNEPTAAAVAYGFKRELKSTVLVYDYGGGTFDASALRIEGSTMRVLASNGDPFLGGSDFDDRLTEFALMTIERTHGINVRSDPASVQRVRFACEEAKRALSEADNAIIQVPYLTSAGSPTPVNAFVPISRDLFESLTEDLVVRSLDIVQSVLDAAGLKTTDLDDIVVVGGQSRSPAIRRMLTSRFGKQPSRNAHPDHAIALGAALVGAAALRQVRVDLHEILSQSIRLGLPNGQTEVLLPRGQSLPANRAFGVPSAVDGETTFKALIFRGEQGNAQGNELLGELTIPSNLALAVTKTKAPVTLSISADGILTATMKHPMTSHTETLEISLPEGDGTGLMEVSDMDFVELYPSP